MLPHAANITLTWGPQGLGGRSRVLDRSFRSLIIQAAEGVPVEVLAQTGSRERSQTELSLKERDRISVLRQVREDVLATANGAARIRGDETSLPAHAPPVRVRERQGGRARPPPGPVRAGLHPATAWPRRPTRLASPPLVPKPPAQGVLRLHITLRPRKPRQENIP